MEKKLYGPTELEDLLRELKIEYLMHEHEPVRTLDDMKQKITLKHAPLIKNIFTKDKKKNGCFLISAHHATQVGKAFYKKIGTTYGNCRMADEKTLDETLGVKPGQVTPFALINDHNHNVRRFVLDANLMKEEWLSFHPMIHTKTVEIKRTDFFKFLDKLEITPEILDLSEEEEEVKTQEQPGKQKQPKQGKGGKKEEDDGETKLKITVKKAENFPDWYSQVIVKGELIEYYEVSGCYILRPGSYALWQGVQKYVDKQLEEMGVENSYFPLFVTEKALFKEKEHVEGFSPEVAWVTRYSDKELKEPIALRPTSETIMYDAFSKWIHSHRDLPMKLNQWSNVVRWEFRDPTPFIRTREFLWQEGHTAHATCEEASQQTYAIQDLYEAIYEELYAVPVIKGQKTEVEKFPGANFTTTVEAFIPVNGRAVQGATSHQLGQNFAKMFNITFLDVNQQKQLAWQTSWGITTRSIGVMIMVHGDDQGLVLPPRIAQTQVVIVPIVKKDADNKAILQKADEIFQTLKKAGIRAKVDDRDNYTPGWKYSHWELKGIPMRLELGPKDLEKGEVRCVRRVDGLKKQMNVAEIGTLVQDELEAVHKQMFKKALDERNERLKEATNWKEFMQHLNAGCIILTPWCGDDAKEEEVKKRSAAESKEDSNSGSLTGAAKTLCIPKNQEPIKEGEKCFFTGKPAKHRVLWGRSY